jgi:hypothetical protein
VGRIRQRQGRRLCRGRRDGGDIRVRSQVNTVPGEGRLNGDAAARCLEQRIVTTGVRRLVDGSEPPRRSRRQGRRTAAGRSRSPRRYRPQAAGDRGWPSLALDRAGRVPAIWLDHRGPAGRRRAAEPVVTNQAQHDGVAMARNSSSITRPAADRLATERGGRASIAARPASAGGDRRCSRGATFSRQLPRHGVRGDRATAADPSAPVPSARRAGRSTRVRTRSGDGGRRGGTVHLAWPTVLGDNPRGAIFYASTRDGQRFTARQQVNTLGGPKPSHPQIGSTAVAGCSSLTSSRWTPDRCPSRGARRCERRSPALQRSASSRCRR